MQGTCAFDGAMAVRDQFSGCDEEPREGISREIIEAAPRGQERVGNDVLNLAGCRAPRDVAGELLYVIGIELSEPIFSAGLQVKLPSSRHPYQ